ncbi:MAG: hypothetical protein A3E87_06200 [Gammaproteobacteria bacterium RIFCSPHIGHO2_12_FULL_35_23]|nr:MAG: hypothetical protein A3E87_06200 [Gammaproteobacteria bacterium RIFCSPHIGHO2_12_FULL_35_23]
MLKIDILKNHPNTIPELAQLWYESLGKHWATEISLTEITHWYHEWLNNDIPLVYVVLDDNKVVGSCSLQLNDGIRTDLFPWLGDLVIVPKYQGQGFGKQLVNFVAAQAKHKNFEKLYLFVFEKKLIQYYSRLGWAVLTEDIYENKPITIMTINLC